MNEKNIQHYLYKSANVTIQQPKLLDPARFFRLIHLTIGQSTL